MNTALKTAKIKGAMISEIPLLPLSSTHPAPPDTSSSRKLLCNDDDESLAQIGWCSFSNTPDLPPCEERWTVFLLDFGTPPCRRKVDPSTKHLLVDSATVPGTQECCDCNNYYDIDFHDLFLVVRLSWYVQIRVLGTTYWFIVLCAWYLESILNVLCIRSQNNIMNHDTSMSKYLFSCRKRLYHPKPIFFVPNQFQIYI